LIVGSVSTMAETTYQTTTFEERGAGVALPFAVEG